MLGKWIGLNWFRYAFVLLLFAALFLGLQALFFVDADNNDITGQTDMWQEFYKQPPGSIDVALIGSSHSFNAFDTEIINDLLGLNSFKMGTGSESIIQTEIEIEELCKYHAPQVIVVEGFSFQHELSENSYLKTINSINNGHLPLSYLFSNPNLYLSNLSPLIREHYLWKLPYRLFRRFQQNARLPSPSVTARAERDLAEETDSDLIELDDYQDSLSEKHIESGPPPDFLQAAENIITNRPCGEQLVVVRAPMIHAPYTYAVYAMGPFEALFKEHRVPYLDLNTQPGFVPGSPLYYQNIHHVSHFGMVIASVETARFLGEVLDRPLDQDQLAYYQGFFFDGYSFERSGDQVTLNLFPSDEQASAGLLYRWEIIRADQQIQTVDYDPAPTVTFTIPSSEGITTKIRSLIRSQQGDYILDGIFRYTPGE